MNFVDEGLEVRRDARAFGHGPSNGRIARARVLEDNLQNSVAKAGVWVGHSVSQGG